MIKAVVFDMDDTLYPESEYVKSGFEAVDVALQKLDIHGFFEKAIELFECGQRGNIFNVALDQLDVTYESERISDLISVYRNHLPNIQLFEDAQIVLEKFSKQYPLGLISDGYLNAQQQKVKALSLNSYFQEILLTDQLGREHWKPSEVPYIKMKQLLNAEHEQLVYIGDNINKDFITAKKLGWLTIQIIRDGSEYGRENTLSAEYQAHFKVKSLLEISNVINKYNFGG